MVEIMSEKPRSIIAERKEGVSDGEPKYWNEKGQNQREMTAEMRGAGVNPGNYIFKRVDNPHNDEEEKPEADKELKSLLVTLIDKIEDLKKEITQSKIPQEAKIDVSKAAEEVKKKLEDINKE